MESIHIERLRTLYSIMAGMPTRVVYMDSWRTMTVSTGIGRTGRVDNATLISRSVNDLVRHDMEEKPHCGTAACALGWAAAYPEFKEAGFSVDQYGSPMFEGAVDYYAGVLFFGLTYDEATTVFRSTMHDDIAKGISQKAVFLNRLRALLLKKKIITPNRNEVLASLEEQHAEAEKNTTFVVELANLDD